MSIPSQGLSLEYLESSSVAFLDLVETLDRPLTRSERKAFRWILVGFESPTIEAECAAIDNAHQDYVESLMRQVREAIEPDPVIISRDPLKLSKREIDERVGLMEKMASGIAAISQELSLAHSRGKNDSRKLQSTSRRMALLGRRFASRFARRGGANQSGEKVGDIRQGVLF